LSFFKFNKILIIESLRCGDSKSGFQLFSDLEFIKINSPILKTDYLEVDSKEEFTRFIEKQIEDIYSLQ
jgi:hypothetical protein